MDDDLKEACQLDAVLCLVDAKHILQHLDEQKPDGVVNEAGGRERQLAARRGRHRQPVWGCTHTLHLCSTSSEGLLSHAMLQRPPLSPLPPGWSVSVLIDRCSMQTFFLCNTQCCVLRGSALYVGGGSPAECTFELFGSGWRGLRSLLRAWRPGVHPWPYVWCCNAEHASILTVIALYCSGLMCLPPCVQCCCLAHSAAGGIC